MLNLAGLIYVVLASIAFGIMPIWVKLAYATGLSAYEVLFLRALLGACFLFIIIRYKRVSIKLEPKQVKYLLFAGTVGYTAGLTTLYLAYNYVSVGVATALHYLFPVIVMLIAVLLYKEKLYTAKWIALVLSIIGVYLMTAIGPISLHPTGVLLGLASAFTFAIYVTGVAHPVIKAIDSLVLAFYVCVISSASSLVLILLRGEGPINLTGEGLFYVTLVAFFCTALALIFFIRGIHLIGPSNASILATLEPIVSIVAGVLVFQEKVSFQIGLGCTLVLVAVFVLSWHDAKKSVQNLK
jgi:drug/metabolite transporter (DMT)-like permease